MRASVQLFGAAVLAAALGSSCIEKPPPRNLLLITVDSLRHDRLGFAGHDRETSSVLDRLAEEGLRFPVSYSQSGWTLPSVASILTGEYPSAHGATEVGRPVRSELPTLATVLAAAGYETKAFVSHVMLAPEQGLARGFGVYDASVLDIGHPHRVTTARELTDLAIAALPSGEAPYFLWVHYFDPHFAYLAHEEWSDWGRRKIDRYDGEIALTDREIGRLLRSLSEAGRMEDTVTVVTSDHGEAFGEGGTWLHYTLREEVARVPLLIHGRSVPVGESRAVAEQIDLVPTVLGLLGVEAPPGLPGRDLLSGAGDAEALPHFLERVRPAPFVQRAVIRGRYKLVTVETASGDPAAAARAGRISERTKVRPGTFLYDLEADPLETENLYSADNPIAIELLQLLEAEFSAPAAEPEAMAIDEETRRRLRALGYVD